MNSSRDDGGGFGPAFGLATPSRAAITLGFIDKALLVRPDDTIPAPSAFQGLGEPQYRLRIGSLGDVAYEMQLWCGPPEPPAGLVKADLRKLLSLWPQGLAAAANRGQQLAVWLHENRFCGVCGGQMETSLLIPARTCPACGFNAFPRVSPVCIVLVARNDEILLARSPHFPPGMYSVLAGFVEAGESVEACAHREVREEVGLKINNLRWFGSQSWPFPHSLMLGFLADYADGTLVLQREEIEDAGWFRRDQLPSLPPSWTIAYHMIKAWLTQASDLTL